MANPPTFEMTPVRRRSRFTRWQKFNIVLIAIVIGCFIMADVRFHGVDPDHATFGLVWVFFAMCLIGFTVVINVVRWILKE
jgi:hypothetical protein